MNTEETNVIEKVKNQSWSWNYCKGKAFEDNFDI
jgi:hypothetical protein